jgi:5'(3')-deoxyribonucleotidase
MKPRIFVDMDGVLADFNGHFKNLFGVECDQDNYYPPNFWELIRNHGNFYGTQPLMPDAQDLWDGLQLFQTDVIILSGMPRKEFNIPNVGEQKMAWVMEHFPDAKLICCPSDVKFTFGKPGDFLIDDRSKYAHYWVDMGGRFILHKSSSSTIYELAIRFPVAA